MKDQQRYLKIELMTENNRQRIEFSAWEDWELDFAAKDHPI